LTAAGSATVPTGIGGHGGPLYFFGLKQFHMIVASGRKIGQSNQQKTMPFWRSSIKGV